MEKTESCGKLIPLVRHKLMGFPKEGINYTEPTLAVKLGRFIPNSSNLQEAWHEKVLALCSKDFDSCFHTLGQRK